MTSIEELHRSEEGRLKRFFQRRLANREDVADAAQETFLRLMVVAPRTLIENPQAYLFQIARSVAQSTSKRFRTDPVLCGCDVADLELSDDAPDAERVVNGRQCLLLMAKAIEELPRRCQEVFILSRIHGMSNGEIAARLGISRNMVERHIIRALLQTRRMRGEISF
ncbi:sigma-70 family RNA polymerase sigma factor [Aminobacter sp. AP02]|uniref:RNA polymerase sigma factor n=1 Tax=Aminobacter sp. AP02 TaxID=2135737 RepID=UPI000D6CE436|nr:sigma-70 family RNA polymerase sigma factor [Aminobacter sp. AP02]PWK69821.1 RNA polymerase sigma-70 factor (ECF subfamily) [Aminobacter sp. AP02]